MDNESGAASAVGAHDRGRTFADRHPDRRARGPTARQRLAGYERALKEHGIPVATSLIRTGSFHREHAIEDATDLLGARPAPTAIFAANNILAEADPHRARTAGSACPETSRSSAFDDVQWMSMVEPPLTAVRQPVGGHGAQRGRARAAPPPRGQDGRAEHGRVRHRAGRTRLRRYRCGRSRAEKARPRREGRRSGSTSGRPGSRAVAVDEPVRSWRPATSEYPLLTPRPQWTEQDPAEWWRARARCSPGSSQACAERAGRGRGDRAHGSDARLGLPRRCGTVIRPALLWNDQRTGKQCAEIADAVGSDAIVEITGNPAAHRVPGPKVLWLRDEEPANFERVATRAAAQGLHALSTDE